MLIKLFTLCFLLVERLSLYDLSPINDSHNQRQLQAANKLVNQATRSTIRSTTSTDLKWIKTLKNITKNGGRTVVLECQVKSSYPVRFTWYRYNNPIDRNRFIVTEDSFRSSIRLRNFKESMAGFYTCQASNDFQTLISTGFVRVKNPNTDPIHFNDDLLPSIDFQPEIISTNDQSIGQFKCEIYSGEICRSYLSSKYISVTNHDIEQNLIDNMRILSNECQEFLLPMICLFVYPICDDHRINIRSICRKSCFHFQNNSCMKELPSLQNIPTCDNLPPSSDDPSCLKIDQHRLSSAANIPLILQRLLPAVHSLPIVFPSICLLMVFICLLISIVCCCRNRRTKIQQSSSKTKSSHLFLSPFHSTIHQNLAASSSSSTNTYFSNLNHRQISLQAEAKYPPSSSHSLCEISYANIHFLQEIGEGDFGRIFIGELMDTNTKCIIKTLENEKAQPEYSREMEIFRHIRHASISNLIGLCLQPENAYSIMINEYLNHGDLHQYLVQQRLKTIGLIDFLHISVQIVSGMVYLSERKFLHNDLAARNIFISEGLDIKITNIARYRREYHSDYYKLANRLLPIRWMSVESLLSGVYSEMSDVWSFGVLLWEMFSYGTQPYFGQTSPEVIEMIRDRKLLTCPINCPRRIYALMCSCWEESNEERPTFLELMKRLRQMEERSTTTSLMEDELVAGNQVESPILKYRTILSANGRLATQSMVVDRNSVRLEV